MRLTGFARFALLSLGVIAFAASTSARAARETENVDRTLAFPAGGTLELHNFSGDVHITGTSGKDIVIKAVRRADRDQLDHIKLDIQTSGSTVSISANKLDVGWDHHDNNVVDTTFEIQVPASAKLNVDVFSSNLDIKGVTGSERLKTFSGTITIDASAAGASPNLSAETFSGDIRAKLAGDAKGDVSFDSFSGRLDSDLPLTLHSAGRSRFRGTLPGGKDDSTLSFHTFSGDVKVTR